MATEVFLSTPEPEKPLTPYSLLNALLARRSRRFAKGMRLNGGPLAYESAHEPAPLSLLEEAVLAFAACGTTGYTMAELPYDTGDVAEAVQPHSVVDNSDCSPTGLTGRQARLMLCFTGALHAPYFKRRGCVCPFMCSCSCLWSASSSCWRGSGGLTGSHFGLPPHKAGPSAAGSPVCSNPAAQTIAPPAVWPALLRPG